MKQVPDVRGETPEAVPREPKFAGEERASLLKPGARFSRYVVRGRLGAGAMGEVYQVHDERLERDVALKLLRGNQTGDPKAVRRFLREAKATSALNHPNIVTIHELSDSELGYFLTMELVEGWSLRVVIGERPTLENFKHVCRQLALALKAAHALGIAHRDIKPENIMIRPDGYVKLLDFGLARLAPLAQPNKSPQLSDETSEGVVIGTARYMSPEQARGDRTATATDIFSLGLVMFEWASGQHPFLSVFSEEVLRAIASDDPPSLAQTRPDWPEEVNRLLHAMLAKEPHRRPTAGEVELALAGLPQNSPGPRSSETRFRTNAAPVSSDFSDRSLAPVNRGGAIVEPGKHPQTRGQASSRPQDALWRLTHASQPKSRLTVAAIAAAVILVAVVIWWMTRGQP